MKSFRLIAAGGLLALAGCGPGDRDAYPVEFQVTHQGKPAVGALVVLHPVGAGPNARRPTGKVDASGVVRLSTFAQDDGAPAGEYTVTVDWRDAVAGPDGAADVSPDKLKGRFSKPDAPTAPRVRVEKQANKVPPLEL